MDFDFPDPKHRKSVLNRIHHRQASDMDSAYSHMSKRQKDIMRTLKGKK